MDTKILLDTTIFIDYLRKGNKSNSLLFRLLLNDYQFATSVIVSFEVEIGLKLERQRRAYETAMVNVQVLPLSRGCTEQAVEIYNLLRANNHLIGLPDTLIGATALHHQVPIATVNEKHFRRIPELELIDLSPYQS